jgi:trans-aconitate 2-methyltransferase
MVLHSFPRILRRWLGNQYHCCPVLHRKIRGNCRVDAESCQKPMIRRWNPEAYLSFSNLHSQPILDLLNRIEIDSPRSILDLGCGPGNSLESAAAHWPHAALTGVDLSKDMLATARARHPGWNWVHASIDAYQPTERFDVVMSCAALQWLHHHEVLLPRLWNLVAPTGALAVQVPANQESPIHRAVFQTAQTDRWQKFTGSARADLNFQPPAAYYSILSAFAGRIDLWETIYHHEMTGHDALLQWARGTVLRPFFSRLPDETAMKEFAADVIATCRGAYPLTSRNTIIYVQKRFFFVAYKNA